MKESRVVSFFKSIGQWFAELIVMIVLMICSFVGTITIMIVYCVVYLAAIGLGFFLALKFLLWLTSGISE